MKVLDLTPSSDGELSVWEEPQEGREYIIGCDPSLGRTWSEGADHSCIVVYKRCLDRRVEQVAEWYGRWPIGRVGEVIACLGRAYGGWADADGKEAGCAIVNIERNLMDAPKFGLVESQGYSEDFLFVPRDMRNITPGSAKVYFTNKDHATQHLIFNTLVDYLDRDAVLIRSKRALDDISALEKNQKGDVNTRGHDAAVATMMALMVDHEMPSCSDYSEGEKNAALTSCPFGMDPVLWDAMHGKTKKSSALGSAVSWSPMRDEW
jgi:hypothetical protein